VTLVRTREEALALVDSALAQFDEQMVGVLAQATVVANGAVQQAEGVVRNCQTKVGALEVVVAAAKEEERRRLQAELIRAREQLKQASRTSKRVADVFEGVRALQRSYAQQYSPIVAAGRGNLAGRVVAVQEYLSGGSGGSGGGSSGSGRAVPGGLGTVLAGLGMTSLSVSAAEADLDDNPIRDGFERHGLSRADYRWAVQTWNDTVGPGLARGMTRDDFAARDNGEPPAASCRRTADVFDMFLGPHAITVDRMPDGSLNIGDGYHRLQIARELGIKDLPGRVHE
jgi:hypothetical protein